MPKVLVNLYARCGNGHQEPTLDDLQNTLRIILGGFSSTFIILDALDECVEREKLLNWIQTLILEKDNNFGLHLIVTSRPEEEIDDKFMSHHYIDLGKEFGNYDFISNISSNFAVDHAEGSVQKVVDTLEQSSPILTGSCSLQVSIFLF